MPPTLLAAKITLECFFVFLFIHLLFFIHLIYLIRFMHLILLICFLPRIHFVRSNHFLRFVLCIDCCDLTDFTTTKDPGRQPTALARPKRRRVRPPHALRHDVRVSAE